MESSHKHICLISQAAGDGDLQHLQNFCLLLVHQIMVVKNTLPMGSNPTFSLTHITILSKDVLGAVPHFPLLFNLFLFFTCRCPKLHILLHARREDD